MDLSIIILTYKYGEKIAETVRSVLASQISYSFEIIVVDNFSEDDTEQVLHKNFPSEFKSGRIKFFPNPTNAGFGRGNNLGIKHAHGRYMLILNPDTQVEPTTIQVMMDFMLSRPDVGIATCRLVKEDGTDDLATRRRVPDPWIALWRFSKLSKLFPRSKRFGAYNLSYRSPDEEQEVESCVGAFMLVSPECLAKTKGFDEDYFMYGEDIDWCVRAREAGFKVWYYPKARTLHLKGKTSKKVSTKALYWFHEAMWIFYKKHLYEKYPKVLSFLVYLGIWARYTVLRLQNAFRSDPYVSK